MVKKVGNGKVGPVTKALMKALEHFEDTWIQKNKR
jgi:hypothetical protein